MSVSRGKDQRDVSRTAGVALRDDKLPTAAVLEGFVTPLWPDIEVVQIDRRGSDASSEKILEFHSGPFAVGLALFPWRLDRSLTSGRAPQHVTHAWLSVRGHFDDDRRAAGKLLARATAAVAATSDAVFVWWGPGKQVMTTQRFVERVKSKT